MSIEQLHAWNHSDGWNEEFNRNDVPALRQQVKKIIREIGRELVSKYTA